MELKKRLGEEKSLSQVQKRFQLGRTSFYAIIRFAVLIQANLYMLKADTTYTHIIENYSVYEKVLDQVSKEGGEDLFA